MAFKPMMSAQGKSRKRDGSNCMPKGVQGIVFVDGIKHLQPIAGSRRSQTSCIAALQ